MHPAKTQCPSRASMPRRMAAVAARWSRPTSSGSPAGSVKMASTPASQASRRAVSGQIGPAQASSPPVTPGAPRGAQREPVDGDPDLGALPADGGQPTGGEGAAGEFDQGVALALAVGAQVAGRAVAVHQGLEGGVQVFPADRVQVPGEVDAPFGGDGHPEDPGLPGGVVQGAVGVDAGDPAADRLGGVLRAQRARRLGQDLSVVARSMPFFARPRPGRG